MQTVVTGREQVSIPAKIRKQFNIKKNTRLEWRIENGKIVIFPIPDDPITAFRESGKGGTTKRLIEDRQREKI